MSNTVTGRVSESGALRGRANMVLGKDGASAYEIACKNGFVGTEAEWLDSLIGNIFTYNDSQCIPEGTDLDSIKTPGRYTTVTKVIVGTLLNMPETTLPGVLFVYQTYRTDRVVQQYVNTEGLTFIRAYYDGSWLAWKRFLTEREPEEDEFETRLQSLEDAVADLMYEPIKITSFTVTPSVAEMGSTVETVVLKWEINKDPVYQSVDMIQLPVDMRETSRTMWQTTNYTFNCQAADERGARDSVDKTLSFYNGVYYGVLADGATIDSAAILTLYKSLTNSREKTFTLFCGSGQRIAYAIPARLGTPEFNVGGFWGGFYLASTFDFTNASGYTEPYDVWLSSNTNLGATTVEVI